MISLLIAIPTYNEIENIDIISRRVLDAVPESQLLFIDDNSPDGTGERLDHLATQDARINVLHRSGKLGIGSAHLAAINFAYTNSVGVLVTMDADLTHSPEHIPTLLKLLSSTDVVVASRFIDNGGLSDWNLKRRAMTLLGHLLTRVLLQIPYDSSGAFRAYRISNIPIELFGLVKSIGYSFFFESIKILDMNKTRITEFPVVLPARTYGHSKMRSKDILKSVTFMFQLSFKSIFSSDDLLISKKSK